MKKITRTSTFTLATGGLLIILGSQALGITDANTSNSKETSTEVSAQEVYDRETAAWLEKELKADRRIFELKKQLESGEISEEEYTAWVEQIGKDLVLRRAEDLRQMKLRSISQLLEEEGRRIRLTVQDINDEISSFVEAKGLLSSTGPKDTPGWYVLEKLAMDRMEKRLGIRRIELENSSDAGDGNTVLDAIKRSKGELDELHKELRAMDKEYELMRESMSTGFADALLLQHMLDTLKDANKQRDDNTRAQMKARLLMLTPAEDEELLRGIIGD